MIATPDKFKIRKTGNRWIVFRTNIKGDLGFASCVNALSFVIESIRRLTAVRPKPVHKCGNANCTNEAIKMYCSIKCERATHMRRYYNKKRNNQNVQATQTDPANPTGDDRVPVSDPRNSKSGDIIHLKNSDNGRDGSAPAGAKRPSDRNGRSETEALEGKIELQRAEAGTSGDTQPSSSPFQSLPSAEVGAQQVTQDSIGKFRCLGCGHPFQDEIANTVHKCRQCKALKPRVAQKSADPFSIRTKYKKG